MSIVENYKIIWLIFISLLISVNLFAQPAQWEQTLSQRLLLKWQAISASDVQQASVSFTNLPNGYRLPACQLQVEIVYLTPLKPGRNGVQLVCKQPFWQQNISVRLRWLREVAYFAKPVRAKQVLNLSDIRLVKQDVGTLNQGYFVDKQALVGMVLRRNFAAGVQIYPSMLSPKTLVKRGESVLIRMLKPQIKIEVKGTALSDGHLNQKIRVKNNRSKKILYARVMASGVVQVD